MVNFLRQLFGFIRPYRMRFFLGVFTGIIAGLIEPLMIATVTFVYSVVFPGAKDSPLAQNLPAWVPRFLKDGVAAAQDGIATNIHAHPVAAVVLVMMIPAVLFLRGFFSYLNVYFLQWAAIRAITDLRVKLFTHLLNLSAGFFNRSSSGELMSRIMNDTAALQNTLSIATTVIVKDPVTLLGLLSYLLWQQPKLTLLSLVVMPLCMLPVIIYARKVRHASRALQKHSAELTQVMNEAFTGHRVVKAYNLENRAAEQFRSAAGSFIGHYMRIVRSMEIPGPLLEFVGSLGVSLVFIYLIFSSGPRPGSADFLKIILAIYSMYRPLKNLTRLHNQLEQARAASERVFELLATKNSVPEPVAPKMLHADKADIIFENLSFNYGEKPVLRNINLTVRAGQLVALVGASGSGKTTLANLLLRFFDPVSGAIKIGGVDLREVSTRDLRDQIAVVTQETILFNDTIRNNIALGRATATDDDIITAARHAYAYEFITQKPEGFAAVVGEKGVALSGGQRQRLAIARAVLKNAPILVLDEATSALDTESERAVQSALDELMKGRTTFCIAHRLSTILHADLIVVLDQGKIVETGRHEELLKRGGVYQKLYELQFAA